MLIDCDIHVTYGSIKELTPYADAHTRELIERSGVAGLSMPTYPWVHPSGWIRRDTYDAERQLTKALPKMAKAATAPELKEAFTSHLEETRGQIERLQTSRRALPHRVRAGFASPGTPVCRVAAAGHEQRGRPARGITERGRTRRARIVRTLACRISAARLADRKGRIGKRDRVDCVHTRS